MLSSESSGYQIGVDNSFFCSPRDIELSRLYIRPGSQLISGPQYGLWQPNIPIPIFFDTMQALP